MNGNHDALRAARYVSLSTYRRDGSPVATPVWFVIWNGRGYFMTTAGTAKVRRLRRDPRVAMAPSGVRGGIRGRSVEGRARLLDGAEEDLGRRAIRAKYGWQAALVAFIVRLRRGRQVYYEVMASGAEAVA
jgi:PPOX class probable F420-dependent enzyme